MKAVVIFHSVCGNDYILAKMYAQALVRAEIETRLLRVTDDDLSVWQTVFPSAAAVAKEISKIPVAAANDLLDADIVILGCPTYFGTVSAEMKAFLDSTVAFFASAPLKGKKAVFFTSSGSNGGGGVFCLETLARFAQHTGMIPLPVAADIQALSPAGTAYGFCHVSGDLADKRPDDTVKKAITLFVADAFKSFENV